MKPHPRFTSNQSHDVAHPVTEEFIIWWILLSSLFEPIHSYLLILIHGVVWMRSLRISGSVEKSVKVRVIIWDIKLFTNWTILTNYHPCLLNDPSTNYNSTWINKPYENQWLILQCIYQIYIYNKTSVLTSSLPPVVYIYALISLTNHMSAIIVARAKVICPRPEPKTMAVIWIVTLTNEFRVGATWRRTVLLAIWAIVQRVSSPTNCSHVHILGRTTMDGLDFSISISEKKWNTGRIWRAESLNAS